MPIEAIRWYMVVVAVLVAVIGTPVLWRRWRTYKIENKYVWVAVIALNFSTGYGTLESLQRNIPGGPRSLISAIALSWLLVAVAYHPVEDLRRWCRFRRKTRRPPD